MILNLISDLYFYVNFLNLQFLDHKEPNLHKIERLDSAKKKLRIHPQQFCQIHSSFSCLFIFASFKCFYTVSHIYLILLCLIVASFSSVFQLRIRNGSGFYQVRSRFGFRIRIRIQEGQIYQQKKKKKIQLLQL